MEIKFNYFSIPLDSIDLKYLPFEFQYKYAYGYIYSLEPLTGRNESICGIYNHFSKDLSSIDDFEKSDILFGPVICPYLPFRGRFSCKKIYSSSLNIDLVDLPKFKYINGVGDCFVMERGFYALFESKKADCKEVEGFEFTNQYAENTIRLRIIVELLKRKGLVGKLSHNEIRQICYNIYRSDQVNIKRSDLDLMHSLDHLLPRMGVV
jgi:hypothetical protein